MKRSYFIFYGSAVAYCISMLAVLQVGNLNITSSTVRNYTVQKCYSGISDSRYMASSSEEHSGYGQPVINYFLSEPSTSREWHKNVLTFENEHLYEAANFTSSHFAALHYSHERIVSFIESDQLYPTYLTPLLTGVLIAEYQKTNKNPAIDSKSTRGFNNIIEFPDKLS
ncbi:hypothetical protein [Chryseobacterium shigense]|uniref:hypothetical protein n=1 Tax=Chryseobacterium shigense TaxID=297244 RepID=UPI000F50F0E3|nr:hypothetical protein [Chryseobacterium shigense]